MKKRVNILIIILLISIAYAGCNGNSDNMPPDNSPQPTRTLAVSPTPLPTEGNLEDRQLKTVDDLINSMTLEEKVGQIFIVAFREDSSSHPITSLDAITKQQIYDFNPGGVVLFSENIDTIPQIQKLIQDMQKAVKFPCLLLWTRKRTHKPNREQSQNAFHKNSTGKYYRSCR